MRIRIVIIDRDKNYSNKIKDYWSKKGQDLEIENFTDPADYNKERLDDYEDLIIVNEDFLTGADSLTDKHIFANKDIIKWTTCKKDNGNLYKYLSMPNFYRAILYNLSKKAEFSSTCRKEEKGSFIIMTAMAGGLGLSSLAYALSCSMAEKSQEKLLYFNPDPFKFIDKNDSRLSYDLADLVCSMRIPHADPLARLKACSVKEGAFYTINPPDNPADFFQIRKDEWGQIFSLLRQEYEKIILDIAYFSLINFHDFLNKGDRLIVLGRDPKMKAAWNKMPKLKSQESTFFICRSEEKITDADLILPYIKDEKDEAKEFYREFLRNRQLGDIERWLT